MTATEPDLVLRPALGDEGPALARLFTATRQAAVPLMPPSVHTADEDVAHLGALVADDEHEVWVAERDGAVIGLAVLTATWLDALYVDPAAQRTGVGGALLDLVKALRPDGFGLWVFESNLPARAFYARHGLVEVERTDGSANEEHAPDLRVVWPGTR